MGDGDRGDEESIMAEMERPVDVDALTKTAGSTGHPVNHICIAATTEEYEAIRARRQPEKRRRDRGSDGAHRLAARKGWR